MGAKAREADGLRVGQGTCANFPLRFLVASLEAEASSGAWSFVGPAAQASRAQLGSARRAQAPNTSWPQRLCPERVEVVMRLGAR